MQGFLNPELAFYGMSGGSGAFGTVPFDFTIEDDGMAKKAQEFMQNQTEVVIYYRMEGVYSVCRSDSSGHFLTGITSAVKAAEAADQNKK